LIPHYSVRLSRAARRALTDTLPEAVAAAAYEFIVGPLANNPHRVGHQLDEPMYPLYSARRGDYRIIYHIRAEQIVVYVVTIAHRRDAYRT
jgi:mRNA interferase RelE/StbE